MATASTTMAETSIKVIKFSGRKQDWIPWQVKHLARASRKGYREVLEGTEKVPTKREEELLDATKEDDKVKIKTVARNKEAYSDLILSMDDGTSHGNVAFDIVRQAFSTDYPSGNAAEAMARLKKWYAPESAPELARLQKIFFGTRQKRRQNPDL